MSELCHRLTQSMSTVSAIETRSIAQHPLVKNHHDDPILQLGKHAAGLGLPSSQASLCLAVRNINRLMFESIEGSAAFTTQKVWAKDKSGDLSTQGGGVMTILRGKTIEKAAVNCSLVMGDKYPSLEVEHKDKPFLAAGVSLICHPLNPFAPIAHMNIRYLKVGTGNTSVQWIGGGADLTPMEKYSEDTAQFHAEMRRACDEHPLGDYQKYSKWCDEYFLIPHYNETRGVGGIFFDYLTITDESSLDLLCKVGEYFARVYGDILSRRVNTPFTDDDKEKHLRWRGRYAEFNLAYDRGTKFGLLSGGNTEAIFASLPPIVKW